MGSIGLSLIRRSASSHCCRMGWHRAHVLLLALPVLAGQVLGQSEAAGWGRQVFNSAWNSAPVPGVGAGWQQTFALRADGTLDVWGNNVSRLCMVPVLPAGVVYEKVSAASSKMLALRSDGTLVVWPPGGAIANVPALPPGIIYVEADV